MPAVTGEFERAFALHQRGQLSDAERIYQSVLQTNPTHFDAAYGLGVVYLQRGMPELSERQLGLALRINPGSAAAHHSRGLALRALRFHARALDCYDKAVLLKPDFAAAHCNRGIVLLDLMRPDDAIASFDRAIALDPGSAAAHFHRGNALLRAMRVDDALACFDAAISCDPNHFQAFNNRGNAFRELNRLEDAIASYEMAIALKPHHFMPYHNRANAQQDLGEFDEALSSYNQAIQAKPDFYEALQGRGTLKLLNGQLQEGFADFENRLRTGDLTLHPRLRAIPAWKGEDPVGKSVLVYGDGAFGDIIQFGRYLPLLRAQGVRVTLLAPARFHRLLAAQFAGIGFESDADKLEQFDFRCELMSLPFHFKTDLASIPLPCAGQPGLLPDDSHIPELSDRTFNIGVCWQGNPERNIDRGRSIPLSAFHPISQIPGIRLISLQKMHGLDQLANLQPDMLIDTPAPEFDSGADAFIDTAALMQKLDLIVSSDTSVAHLAATLGRPTWIALKYVPEWRWMLGRNDSPWYPTVRLFRQPTLNRWAPVFDAIAVALRDEIARRTSNTAPGSD
jgi:tetratricopeptide (TPR) repeat protein